MITLVLALMLVQQPAPPSAAPASPAEQAFKEANDAFAKNDDENNKKALAVYERAISLEPARADFYVGKGRTLARMRKYDEAFAAYGAALKLEPNNPMILRYRGHNYINVKRLDDALADLTKAEAMKKDDNGIYYHLALAYYFKGEYAKAADALRRLRPHRAGGRRWPRVLHGLAIPRAASRGARCRRAEDPREGQP